MAKKSTEKKVAETPLMKQYNSIKAKYPTALLLFRVGDFYETFGADAIKASKILDIVLTKRANGKAMHIELAGFPHHSLETYLPKLVKAGEKVAICDQLEDPKLTKTIVKRGVTELVTPGLAYSDNVLDNKKNNFLASVHLEGEIGGISFLDISTGEFFVAEGSIEYLGKLLQGFNPSEVIVRRDYRNKFADIFGGKFYLTFFEDWVFTHEFSYESLTRHFKTNSLKGFGIEKLSFATIAAGAALHYLSETQHRELKHITSLSRIEEDQYVWLDQFTIRNLELIHSPHPDGATLISVIDNTQSPMGARLMKRWMVLPLKNIKPIQQRQDIVEYFFKKVELEEELQGMLKNIGDLERLVGKVSIMRVNPRELLQLKKALFAIPKIKQIGDQSKLKSLQQMVEQFNPCKSIAEKIQSTLKEEPSVQLVKGNVIAEGVSPELDEYRSLQKSGKTYLSNMRNREHERTGISSLKVGYNNVFGYYLEVTNAHKDKVPEEWIRKQTLTNSERYITEELKEYETKILSAEENIYKIESRIYENLILEVANFIQPIQLNAHIIAQMDCLLSFSSIARNYKYVRPTLNDGFAMDIKGGRHPVIEQHLPPGTDYVDNDVFIDQDKQQLIILTGPNMSGKSALLRQTALISLMAQMGSFVPAKKVVMGLVDKIFTRVGASDNIASGESTFMVEMNETASILNNISNRSLILLDEIGRGTSTYDGISIAWAIAEYLHEHPAYKAKVLFATHYHELNELANTYKRVKNYHISVKEINNKIIFLRKLTKGGSEHSFGIHVARMAGMPKKMLKRSEEILKQLEKSHSREALESGVSKKVEADDNYQLSFIQLDDPLLQQIKEDILNTDINTLTPVEALMKLNEIKQLITRKK